MAPEIIIRDETGEDRSAVRTVNERAFGQPGEATLVEALHRHGAAVVALVAESAENIVGHILFSPVHVELSHDERLLGLAPMAVLPSHQRQAIGSRLVEEGLKRCAALGWDGVVVLGHPEYYPRFGFERASRFGLRWEAPCDDAAFMALALRPGTLDGRPGVVRYRPEFGRFV